MTKIWCPICRKTSFNTPQNRNPTQKDIFIHLQEFHRIASPEKDADFYRDSQDREWESHCNVLQRQLNKIGKKRRRDFEDFGKNAGTRELPGNAVPGEKAAAEAAEEEMCDSLQVQLSEMMEVHSDSEDHEEKEGKGEEKEAGETQGTKGTVEGGTGEAESGNSGWFGTGTAYAKSERWHQGGGLREDIRDYVDRPGFMSSGGEGLRRAEDAEGAKDEQAANEEGAVEGGDDRLEG